MPPCRLDRWQRMQVSSWWQETQVAIRRRACRPWCCGPWSVKEAQPSGWKRPLLGKGLGELSPPETTPLL